MAKSERYLADVYKNLGNLKSDFRNFNLTEFIVSKVKGKKVLDIGSGNGYLLERLRQEGKTVVGLEPNRDLIDLSKKMFPKVKVIQGTAEEINKKIKEKFDVITMIDVLEHIQDDDSQVKRVKKLLNKGGRFLVFVPVNPLLYGKRDVNLGHFRRYTKKRLTEVLSRNGFKIEYSRFYNMIGVFPYFISEKIFGKEFKTDLRESGKKSLFNRFVNKAFHVWFKGIENNINAGFGFSMVCVGRK